jgi:hypothetical protein
MASRVKKSGPKTEPALPDVPALPKYRIVKRETRWQVIYEDQDDLRITERQAQACADLLNEMARFPEAREITVHVRR